jgi:hypothetical protein
VLPAAAPPAPPAAPAPPHEDAASHANDQTLFEKNCVLALRASGLHLQGTDADQSTFGFSLWSEQAKYSTRGALTMRGWGLAGLGGGSGGFEGALGGGGAFGYRASIDEDQGPLLRIGFDGAMLGNQRLYVSWIEVPQGQVAYQYLHDGAVVEVGMHGGPVLAGRFNVGNDARRDTTGSLEWGPYLSMHTAWGRLDATWMHVLATGWADGSPVDIVRGNACLYVESSLGVCIDGSFYRGVVQYGEPLVTTHATAFYGGLLLGYRPDSPD